MNTYLLSLVAVILFCVCSHQLMKAVLAPIPVFNNTAYTKSALRVAKAYKIASWGIMTICFLLALVISFYQVFTEI
ncbi:hypothetical protein [Bdellovibrio sp. HCB337]|uniref:hypothetical protein n=1 Tax=Bdellovibrio sp. HCB337 TaxID=3394358 RepID=UPI0039A5F87D